MLRYTSQTHRFFDNLVVYLGAVSSLALGSAAQHSGQVRAFEPTENIVIRGSSKVTNIEILLYPYQILHPILNGEWPNAIELEDQPLSSDIPGRLPTKVSGVRQFHMIQIQLAFIHYFETVRSCVETNFGRNVHNWPSVWNFGRVVRNTFAHGGQIHFTNPNASSVSWKSLTYGPTDNGRQILYQDITPVELIFLMGDMDAAV